MKKKTISGNSPVKIKDTDPYVVRHVSDTKIDNFPVGTKQPQKKTELKNVVIKGKK